MEQFLGTNHVNVEVCVCTGCVMNGAIGIIEAIESLQELREQLCPELENDIHNQIHLTTNKCLGEYSHPEMFPYVQINGQPFPKATCENIMSEIMSKVQSAV